MIIAAGCTWAATETTANGNFLSLTLGFGLGGSHNTAYFMVVRVMTMLAKLTRAFLELVARSPDFGGH